jgi:hypothetical protein
MEKWPTEAELRKLCRRWQQMLRLQDWKIEIQYARIREMLHNDDIGGVISWGRCSINDNHKRAKVYVLHPDDYEDDLGREEIEETVVHELLHVQMSGMRSAIKGPDPAGDLCEEQVINIDSELLVSLYGKVRAKK